jgi:hypothetical protein
MGRAKGSGHQNGEVTEIRATPASDQQIHSSLPPSERWKAETIAASSGDILRPALRPDSEGVLSAKSRQYWLEMPEVVAPPGPATQPTRRLGPGQADQQFETRTLAL